MIAAPVFISLITALITLASRPHLRWIRFISLIGSVLCFGVSVNIAATVLATGSQSIPFGGWPAPFAISFAVDTLSALLLLVSSLIALCGTVASIATVSLRWEYKGYYTLFHFLMMGVFGAFSTGDLFNLYVWFEVLLMASFFLVSFTKHKSSVLGGFKYAVINIISSLLFLMGLAFIFGAVGTLDMKHFVVVVSETGQSMNLKVGLSLLVAAFAIKAGLFPFYFWLPASYPATLTAMAAVFSGLLTKVGVYAMLRVLAPLMVSESQFLLPYLYLAALISMVLGVLGALSQENIKGILSFHIISQVGYIVLCFSLGTSLGIAACVFYLLHHIVVKTNLFLATAYIEKVGSSVHIGKLGGFWQRDAFISVMFALSALSLIGIPPLSGFWAKVFTLQSALDQGKVLAIILCLLVSLFTLMSMLKIWLGVFWKPYNIPEPHFSAKRFKWLVIPLVLLNIWTLSVGLASAQVFQLAQRVSLELTQGGRR